MYQRILLLTLLLVSAASTYSQGSNYTESAYVVTYKNDSIWGQCLKVSAGKYFNSMKIKLPDGREFKFKESMIKAAGFITNEEGIPSDYNTNPIWRQYEKIANPNDLTDSVMIEKIAYGPRMQLFLDPISRSLPKLFLKGFGFSFGSFGTGFNIDLGAMANQMPSYIIIKEGKQPVIITPNNFEKLYRILFTDCWEFTELTKKDPGMVRFEELPNLVSDYNSSCMYKQRLRY